MPFAHTNLVPIPPGVTDDQAIMVSDIFPTAWFGARLAEVSDGDVVAMQAYEAFDRRDPGWTKVTLDVG